MKISRIILEPKIVLEFTRAEVETLKLLAENHYDATVRALVPPGKGAVINGLLNSFEEGSDKADSSPLTNREVQLLIKACEMSVYPGPGDRQLGWLLGSELYSTLRKLEQAGERANRKCDCCGCEGACIHDGCSECNQ